MIRLLLIVISLGICNLLVSQTNNGSVTKLQLLQAKELINGKQPNPIKAFELYTAYAQQGNAEAMNGLGILYKKGWGTSVNTDKAKEWFTKAIKAGYIKANYNLGIAYKEELNFVKAYQYFSAIAAIDAQSAYAKGYMLYKGLGCTQDYKQAAGLFMQGAELGKANSMYFLGLCYRNGYGIKTNTDSARYWLVQAADKGYTMAKDELMLKEPENVSVAGGLVQQIKAAQDAMPKSNPVNKYKKVENQIPVGDVAGIYTGYLLKYDWSGQNVVEASTVKVNITYQNDSIKGKWQEGDSLIISLNAKLTPHALVFDRMKYKKINHYSKGKSELAVFEKARLQLTKADGNIYLSGNIQQFIPSRNEPAKPQYLALVRTSATSGDGKIDVVNEDGSLITSNTLLAYPNPFGSVINIDFELKEAVNVVTTIATIEGKIVYTNPAGVLPAGSYTLPIQTQQIASGYYILTLHYGKKVKSAKVVKL